MDTRSGPSKFRPYGVALFFAVAFLIPGLSLAQIEEVIVTAQKRAESAQDVGVAITAFSGDDLQDSAITQARDLFQRIPNVSIASNSTAGQLQISIRGINYLTFSPVGVQPVLIFQDEVVMGSPASSGLFIFDLERVEVLRGPQNTFYGRNTTGGAVNFISRRPEIGGESNGYFDLTAGRFGLVDANAAFGGPVGDNAAFRVAVQSLHNNGYWKNLTTGDRMGKRDQTIGRFQFAWAPSDNLDILFNIHGGESNGGQRGIKSHGLLDDPALFSPCDDLDLDNLKTSCVDLIGAPTIPDTDKVTSELSNDVDDISAFGGSIRADLSLASGATLTSITAFEENDYDHWEDADGIAIPFVNFRQKSDTDQWSQEFRLTSADDESFRWILGAYGLWEETRFETSIPILQDLPEVALTDVGDVTQKTAMYSVFAQGDWDLSDQLTLNAGIRFITEEKDGVASYVFALGLDAFDINDADAFLFGPLSNCCGVPGTLIDKAPFKKSWDMWGGKIGLEYAAADNRLLYAHISRGVKAGQFTDAPPAIADGGFFAPADPETVLSYEGGFKSSWSDNTVTANFAVFYNDYDDQQQQITFVDPDSGLLTSTVVNAAKVRTSGIEFEGQFAPGDGWYAALSIGLLDTKVKKDSLAARTGGALAIEEGRDLTNSPDVTINATLEKIWDFSFGGSLTAHVDGRYTGERTYNLIDTAATRPFFTDPSYFLLNAYITYRFGEDNRYRVSAYGKNLTDEIYHHLLQEFEIGNVIIFASDPRTWGVTVGVEF